MKIALKIVEKQISLTEDIPTIVVSYTDVISYVKEYRVHKNVWTPHLQEQVHEETEPNNPEDKDAVAVKKDDKKVRHLSLRKKGKFAKTIFHFLCGDSYGKCNITVTGKAVSIEMGLF